MADGSSGLRAIHTTCTDYKSPAVERPVESESRANTIEARSLVSRSFDGGGAVAPEVVEVTYESEGIAPN